MGNNSLEPYQRGVLAAQKAIANEVPRWVTTGDLPFGQHIHSLTGLPLMSLSGPPELQQENDSFAKGNNDEVTSAIASGAVDVDFRPLLVGREECFSAMSTGGIGVLSTDNTKLEANSFGIVIQLGKDSKRKTGTIHWVSYTHHQWGTWPRFQLYEGPIEFAIAKDGLVLLVRGPSVVNAYDAETTQILNTYPT